MACEAAPIDMHSEACQKCLSRNKTFGYPSGHREHYFYDLSMLVSGHYMIIFCLFKKVQSHSMIEPGADLDFLKSLAQVLLCRPHV